MNIHVDLCRIWYR